MDEFYIKSQEHLDVGLRLFIICQEILIKTRMKFQIGPFQQIKIINLVNHSHYLGIHFVNELTPCQFYYFSRTRSHSENI